MPEGYSEEPGVSGAQAIEKVRGRLTEQKRVESKFGTSEFEGRTVEPKDQIQVTLEDAAILKMMEDAQEYELPEGRLIFWIPFAKKGQTKAHSNSVFQKCWVDTAKEVYDKPPSQLNGEMITLEKQPRILFTDYEKDSQGKFILNDDGEKIKREVRAVDKKGRPRYFCFIKDEGISSADIGEYVKGKIKGLNTTAAMREIVMDNRLSQFPELKTQLENDTDGFATKYGLSLVDDKFVES